MERVEIFFDGFCVLAGESMCSACKVRRRLAPIGVGLLGPFVKYYVLKTNTESTAMLEALGSVA